MTQKKPLQEQVASHAYKRPVVRETPRTLQRVVTIPEASPLDSWNEFELRRKQINRSRTRPHKYVGPMARTFAQTGSYASGGQSRTLRRSLPEYGAGARVPRRSGRQTVRKGILWKLFGVLMGGLLLMLAANFAFAGNAFRIEQVTVVGTHNDALIRSIQKMGMQGQNIFLLNVPALSEQVAALPLVSSVTLSKQLPNQLTVTVSERTPTLLWSTPQGVFSIDHKGVVIAAVNAGSSALNTVVDVSQQNTQGKKIQPGDQLNQADIVFASELFKQLPTVLGDNTFNLHYDGTIYANPTDESAQMAHRGTFAVKSENGWLAYLGGANDVNPLENRLLELQQMLLIAQKQQLKLATIDLRYGLHPVYTLK
jgi:hypothetical protein